MRFQVRNDKELIFLSFICFYLIPVKEHMHTVITTGFFFVRSEVHHGLGTLFELQRTCCAARTQRFKKAVLCCYPDYDR